MADIRVLVVDDHAHTQDIFVRALRLMGWDVHTANGGGEALRAAHRLHPDLILLDYRMPDVDGGQVLRELRACGSMDETDVFVISGLSWQQGAPWVRQLGADGYLTKPLRPTTLLSAMQRWKAQRAKRGRKPPRAWHLSPSWSCSLTNCPCTRVKASA